MKTKIGFGAVIFILFSTISTAAWAYQEPSAGSFGYEIYEFLDTSVIAGAIGISIAIGILGYCIYFILRTNIFGAIVCAIAAFLVVKIKDIAFSLGINFPSQTLSSHYFPYICMSLIPLALILIFCCTLTMWNSSKKNNV